MLTCGAGAEPVGRLQVLDATRVLAGDVDGGGWGHRRMKPRLTGGLGVWGEDLENHSSPLSPWVVKWEACMGLERPGRPGPYLLGGCEAGEGAQVGGVGDEHGLLEQPGVRILGHLGLVAVEGWRGRERGDAAMAPWASLGASPTRGWNWCSGRWARGPVNGPVEPQWRTHG